MPLFPLYLKKRWFDHYQQDNANVTRGYYVHVYCNISFEQNQFISPQSL